MMKRWITAGLFLWLATPVWAETVHGVVLPDSVAADGQRLVMNGAGLRTAFFFDVYVGALYLPIKSSNANRIISSKLPKQITLHFLLGDIGRSMITAGWTRAFERELSAADMARMRARIKKFNSMFTDVEEDDQYSFVFHSDGTTVIRYNHKTVGTVEGDDFQRALLGVWLGQQPDDRDLKQAMLNGAA